MSDAEKINVPLGSFPVAIKEVVALIVAGKINEAVDILKLSINMG